VNRAVVILGTTALLAVAGCANSTGGSGRIAADARVPGTSGTPVPPGGTPSAGITPGPASGQTVAVGTAQIPLTKGAKATKDGDHLCLTLLNDTGCTLEVIDIRAARGGGGSVSNPAPGAPNGWWWGSDVPSCGSGSDVGPVTKSTVLQSGFRKVGEKNAAYGTWKVSCQNSNLDFDARLWWLPTSQIAFRQRSTAAGAAEAVDAILAGVRFTA
jgi:hypothetical protein